MTGLIQEPKILAYSKKSDIVLGKLDNIVGIDPIPIYQGNINPEEWVYSLFYRNKDYIEDHLLDTVTVEGTFTYDLSLNLDYTPAGLFPLDLNKTGINSVVGQIVHVAPGITIPYENGRIIDLDDYYIVTGQNERGDSGAPSFTMNSNLMGLVVGFLGKQYQPTLPYTICSRPEKIRGLIEYYISAQV